MNPTRRNFLTTLTSALSALPLIGWLFGRAEAKPVSFPAKITGGYVRPTFPIEHDPLEFSGRWIPVTERLPEVPKGTGFNGVCVDISRELLVSTGKGVCSGRLWKHEFDTGHKYDAWLSDIKDSKVTHWAELPTPPETQS